MDLYLNKIKAKQNERQEVKEITKGIIKNVRKVIKSVHRRNNIPVIANGKVNRLQRTLKSLISCDL